MFFALHTSAVKRLWNNYLICSSAYIIAEHKFSEVPLSYRDRFREFSIPYVTNTLIFSPYQQCQSTEGNREYWSYTFLWCQLSHTSAITWTFRNNRGKLLANAGYQWVASKIIMLQVLIRLSLKHQSGPGPTFPWLFPDLSPDFSRFSRLVVSLWLPSVLWQCWVGAKKSIRPVKNWMMGCWHGYLFGGRYK